MELADRCISAEEIVDVSIGIKSKHQNRCQASINFTSHASEASLPRKEREIDVLAHVDQVSQPFQNFEQGNCS